MKVLVVDDEKMIAQGIAHVIRQFSFPLEAVDVAFSGREALQQLQKARYQLLITDVSMPEMSGLDLIARVREQDLCPSICILSGYSEFEYARAALRYGVDDYLLKPVDKDKLFKMLERVLNKGQKAVAQRRRNTESMLSECLFEGFDLDQTTLALFRGPVSVTVLSCFFQREQSILRKDLQGLYEAGLAEEIIQILHFPAFALFGKPETQSLLVKKVRADYPAMAVGYASGAVTGRDSLQLLYEKALQASLLSDRFLDREPVNGSWLQVPMSQNLLQKSLWERYHIRPAEKQLFLYFMAWKSMSSYVKTASPPPKNPYVRQMLAMVEANFRKELTLNMVAKDIGINPNYAGQLFRGEVGISFLDYLNRYRIEQILECILQTPTLSFEQVALNMGFSDMRNFYRVFKRIMGTTPGKYRSGEHGPPPAL